MSIIIQEGYVPGCIGRITQLHASYYSATNGFGSHFEAKVAKELSDFCMNYQASRDGIWLAMRDGCIEGSVVIDGAKAQDDGAHLRWFIASDAVKGAGIGKKLLSEAMSFVDSCGYKTTYLWTFSGLAAARHLYESHNFRLEYASPGSQWGTPVTEQRFVRGGA